MAIKVSDPEDTVTIAMMMVAWVSGLVLISKTNFMTTEMENRTTKVQSAALELRARWGWTTQMMALRACGGRKGSAGTIGLGTIF